MLRLASILYSIIGTTLGGSFMVASLVTGNDTLVPILIAVAAGFVLAVPVSYFVAKAIVEA